MIFQHEVFEDNFFGLDIADDILFIFSIDDNEAILKMWDLISDLFSDRLLFFQHEELFKGYHDVFDSLVCVVHHSIDELYLQFIQIIL